MLTRIKDKITRVAQRALGIDDVRFKLAVIIDRMAQLEPNGRKL
jgi:hypothetical protein